MKENSVLQSPKAFSGLEKGLTNNKNREKTKGDLLLRKMLIKSDIVPLVWGGSTPVKINQVPTSLGN